MAAAESPESSQDESSGRTVADYVVSILLFAIAAALLVAGIVLLPDRGAIPDPNGITMTLLSESAPVDNIGLDIGPGDNGSSDYVLVITLGFQGQAAPDAPTRLELRFQKPFRVVRCKGCSTGGGAITFTYYGSSGGSKSAELTTQNLLLSGNGEYISGDLPFYFPLVSSTNPTMSIGYSYLNASSYQWSGAIVPSVGSDDVDWRASPYPSEQGSQISAVNPGAQSSDSTKTFFAGAFVGIAGAALVGGLTELLHVHPQTVAVGWLRRRQKQRTP